MGGWVGGGGVPADLVALVGAEEGPYATQAHVALAEPPAVHRVDLRPPLSLSISLSLPHSLAPSLSRSLSLSPSLSIPAYMYVSVCARSSVCIRAPVHV